jgi:hypothetical protein
MNLLETSERVILGLYRADSNARSGVFRHSGGVVLKKIRRDAKKSG